MTVRVYTRQFCPNCPRVLDFFSKNSIDVEKIDVTEDMDQVEFLKTRGHMALPVVMVLQEDSIVDEWSGVKRDKMDEIVKY